MNSALVQNTNVSSRSTRCRCRSTLLDVILLGVMLISGLLAPDPRVHARGAVDRRAGWRRQPRTLWAFARLKPYAQQYFNSDIVASAVTAAGVFLWHADHRIDLHRTSISDRSSTAASGRLTARSASCSGSHAGSSLSWLHSCSSTGWCRPKQQPSWVANAKSRVVLQATGSWLMSLLPEDVDKYISKAFKKGPKGGPGDEEAPADAPAGPAYRRRFGHVALRGPQAMTAPIGPACAS